MMSILLGFYLLVIMKIIPLVDWKEYKWQVDGIPLCQHPVVFGLDYGEIFFFSPSFMVWHIM